MNEAVVALGSNMGNKTENLQEAIKMLKRLPNTTVEAQSAIYESTPEDMSAGFQEDYHNMVVVVRTNMSPMALLGACLGMEAAMGRVREDGDASRIIDLDLLLYEGIKNESFELTLPHPRMLQRAFVLLPLKDLYPSGRAPGVLFEPHLKAMDTSQCKKL